MRPGLRQTSALLGAGFRPFRAEARASIPETKSRPAKPFRSIPRSSKVLMEIRRCSPPGVEHLRQRDRELDHLQEECPNGEAPQ